MPQLSGRMAQRKSVDRWGDRQQLRIVSHTARFHRPLLFLLASLLLPGCPPGPGLARPDQQRPPAQIPVAVSDTVVPAALTLRLIALESRIGGQAVLLSDSGGERPRHVLIDGGEAERDVLEALRAAGVTELALVVLTHPHADHYGGLTAVMRELPVQAFAWNGDTRTLASFQRLLVAVDSSGAVPMLVDESPRTVSIASGFDTLVITLLPPHPRETLRGGDPINNRSVGVRIERGGFTALVPGDAEHQALSRWTLSVPELLDVDVLVASHHGSDDANATARRPQWYRTVTPSALLVSANGRQHPYANVLDFAERHGVATYCTHTHGSVAVRVVAEGAWSVTTDREAPCTAGTRAPR